MRKYIAFIVILLMIFLLAWGYSTYSAPPSTDRSLIAMTCNIGDLKGLDADVGRLTQIIREYSKPDVLFLQEVQGKKEAASLAKRTGMKSYIYTNYGGSDNFGIAVLAGKDLRKKDVLYFKSSRNGRCLLVTEMEFQGKILLLGSVHLDRIDDIRVKKKRAEVSLKEVLSLSRQELFDETVRSRSVEELLSWMVSRQDEYVIIGGDFNSIPFSKPIRLMNRQFRDALWPSADYFKGSYSRTSLPVAPRLDYIFHSPSISSRKAFVVPRAVGDHHPVYSELSL